MITEEPKYFAIVEGKDLEGKVCDSCNEPFKNGVEAYKSKINHFLLERGKFYHLSCLRNYIFPVVNCWH